MLTGLDAEAEFVLRLYAQYEGMTLAATARVIIIEWMRANYADVYRMAVWNNSLRTPLPMPSWVSFPPPITKDGTPLTEMRVERHPRPRTTSALGQPGF